MDEGLATIPPVASAAPDVVRYTLTRWERFRTLVWVQTRSRVVRLFAACVVLVLVGLAFRNGGDDSLAVNVIATLFQLGLVFVVGAGAMVLTAFMTAFLTTDRSVVGPLALTFADEGFTAESSIGKTHFKWTALQSILVANGFVYLRISDTKFLGIPQRAFVDAKTARLFATSLRRRLEGAKR
jgi:hypothetical protein